MSTDTTTRPGQDGKWKWRKVGEGWIADPTQLLANAKNWRIHPANQQAAMADALGELGWIDEIKVQAGTDVVINGHMRVAMAITESEGVPVSYYDLTDEEVDLALASFDSLGWFALKDQESYATLLGELSRADNSLTDLLNELHLQDEHDLHLQRALAGGRTEDDDEPDADEVFPVCQEGDLWHLGAHRLLVSDATQPLNWSILLADDPDDDDIDPAVAPLTEQVALVFTDPPYGVAYAGGTKRQRSLLGDDPEAHDELLTIFGSPFELLNQHRAAEAACFCFCADKAVWYLMEAARLNGWIVRAGLVWVKQQAQFGALGAQYKHQHEPYYYLVQPKRPPHWSGPTNSTTVKQVDRASKNEYHSTQKPVALAEEAILYHTEPGQIVVDLYAGGGSTLIAAEKTGRCARVMEIDTRYADVIVRRWQDYTGEVAVRDDGMTWDELALEVAEDGAVGEEDDDADSGRAGDEAGSPAVYR